MGADRERERDACAPSRYAGAVSNSGARMRILLVDDHAVVLAGLRSLIDIQDDMTVVGEAQRGQEALRIAEEFHPDVAVVDLSMPDMSGIALIKRLRTQAPNTRCVVLTMHDDAGYMRAVLEAGGIGYVAKSRPHRDLLQAIRSAYERRSFLAVSVSEPLPHTKLTTRERDVLRLVALGHTNKAIGEKLGLSVKSIELYRSRVRQKLDAHTRADMVRWARELGLDLSVG